MVRLIQLQLSARYSAITGVMSELVKLWNCSQRCVPRVATPAAGSAYSEMTRPETITQVIIVKSERFKRKLIRARGVWLRQTRLQVVATQLHERTM